jgi:diguanylate cyclase (GGDEF)-like protein
MLDLRTINTMTSLMGLMMAFLLWGMHHYYPRRIRGTLMWALSPLVGGASALVYGLAGVLPASLVAILGNSLVFASAALNLFGSARFYNVELNERRWLAGTCGVLAAIAVFMVIWPDYRIRVLLFTVGMTAYTGAHARLHWRHGLGFAGRVLAVLLMVRCAILMTRGLTAPFMASADANLFVPDLIQIVYLSSFNIGGMITCLGLVLLASERISAEFEHLANVDTLTGIASRRAILHTLEVELARWRRKGQRCAVLLLDLDHFKRINDTHGHAAGDQVLIEFTRTAASVLRAGDVIGRYGGEEFLVVLPDADLEAATRVAQRICDTVAGRASQPGHASCTTSIGCAVVSDGASTVSELLARADAALYRAKQEGRNTVRHADSGDMLPA